MTARVRLVRRVQCGGIVHEPSDGWRATRTFGKAVRIVRGAEVLYVRQRDIAPARVA